MKARKYHHQLILRALDNFNSQYFKEHHILFGGGTRIALELNEYRESVDIDFICPDKAAYRAVRSQVTNISLGQLVKHDFEYPREIRADRDSVRCFIKINEVAIKLEFVSFADYNLRVDESTPFVVPAIDKSSCYITKILANTDRYNDYPYKDIFDLLAMFDYWGEVPKQAWLEADIHYGLHHVMDALFKASCRISEQRDFFIADIAECQLKIDSSYANKLIKQVNLEFFQYLTSTKDKIL